MARDRQRSKARQRQQQRRDERLAERRSSGTSPQPEPATTAAEDTERDAELEQEVDRMIGAPVHDLGTSGRTAGEAAPEPSFDTDDETLFEDSDGGRDGGSGDGGTPGSGGPRGHRGSPEGAEHHKRGRLLAFLVAVWAELQRVQWPDRRQLTQLTGVVLFFVLIVGAYLGGLDAVFSKLIQAIL
jgi:preprotein translocase subunit SecE